MSITNNCNRKLFIQTLLLILVPILIFLSLLLFIKIYQESNVPFTNYTYPSMNKFNDILNSNDVSNFSILNDFKPRLTNKVPTINSNNIKIIIIVKSAMENMVHRYNIRKTWGSRSCATSHNFIVYFALGHAVNNSGNSIKIEKGITEESRKHNDILRFNFVDTYVNNTYKVMAIMNHFVKAYSHVPYLLIVDDDFFVDPSSLTDTITNKISKFEYERFFGGYVNYNSRPQRELSSKRYVSMEQYPYTSYPPYATGGFLLISNPMVKVCDKLLPYMKYWSNDDVLLGMLLFELNVYPVHLNNILPYRTAKMPNDMLACHDMSNSMISFWKKRDYQRKC